VGDFGHVARASRPPSDGARHQASPPTVSRRASRTTVERNRHVVAPAEVARWLQPRLDVVQELPGVTTPGGTTTFGLETGPVHLWERTVTTAPAPATPGSPPGAVEVTEEVHYRLAVPVWGVLFRFALHRHLRRPPSEAGGSPWWAPSVVLDARAATVLSLLCIVGAVAGYLGTLITQMLTYAAQEFGAGTGAQGTLLASVRVGVLLSLVVVSFADRRGRRSVLLAAVIGACLFTALGAVAPGMVWLGVSQTFARSMSTVVALLVAIMAVEEMPAGARAFSVSVLTMTAGLGAGLCVANLVYVDMASGAWRIAFLLPLLAVYPCWRIGRRLPETHRFAARKLLLSTEGVVKDIPDLIDASFDPIDETEPTATPGPVGRARGRSSRQRFAWRRFVLLSCSGFLWSLFLAPAAQFLNEFLRTERGFSGALIAVFVLATNTPAGIGIVVGGKLADRRGRRRIGAIGIIGGVGFTVVSYLSWGWPLWVASLTASVIGALAVPALAVYGPELFPTGQRGAANGGLQVVSVAGSSTGLLLAGWMADRLGGLGPAMAVLAIGPAVLVVLVLVFFPETAGRELEDLNPQDRAPGAADPTSDGTTLT
jgi:MFS family permease